LTQFVEQPRVLDGDDGLVGERLDERDFLAIESRWFVMRGAYGAKDLIQSDHRSRNDRIVFEISRDLLCGRWYIGISDDWGVVHHLF
jgi:hypothetical protein